MKMLQEDRTIEEIEQDIEMKPLEFCGSCGQVIIPDDVEEWLKKKNEFRRQKNREHVANHRKRNKNEINR